MNTIKTSTFDKKQVNRNRIFRLILKSKIISRQELAHTLHLSLPTVNQYLEELFCADLIIENGQISSTNVGRKAKAIVVNDASRIAVGLDLTQHHFTLVAVSLSGKILCSVKERFTFKNDESCYTYLNQKVNTFIEENGWSSKAILGIGVSLPAIITHNGTYVENPKLVDGASNFFKHFGKECRFPHRLYNDSNAGGFSEIYALGNIHRMVYLSLSHSIGGAVIENNLIIEGNNYRGGEFGHLILVPNGERCHCGQCGCANMYCSPDALSALTDNNINLFFDRLAQNDPICRKAFDKYLDYLSILIHNVRMCFDCDIVIGGGMGRYVEGFLSELRERTRKLDSFDTSHAEYIKCCHYPSAASAVGAALFFINDFISSI